MATRCRLCAEAKPLNDIECTITDQQINIRQMLLDCCRWSAFESDEYENLPQIVCKECFSNLQQSWQFANTVANAQQCLLDYSNHGRYEVESQPLFGDGSLCVAFDFKVEMGHSVLSNDNNVDAQSDAGDANADDNHARDLSFGEDDQKDPIVKCEAVFDGEDDHANDNFDRDSSSEEDDREDPSVNKDAESPKKAKTIDDEELPLPNVVIDKKFKLMKHVHKNACLTDGTIAPAVIERLQLSNWSIIQYHCSFCNDLCMGPLALRQHVKEEHRYETYKNSCKLCSEEFPTTRKLSNHMCSVHLRYLRHW